MEMDRPREGRELPSPSTARSAARDPTFVLFLLMLFSLPLARPSLLQVGISRVQATDLLLGALYLSWAWQVVRGRRAFRPDWLLGAAVLYVAVLAVSIAASDLTSGSNWLKLLAFAAYAVLPWLTAQIVRDGADLAAGVRAWLVGTVVAIAVVLGGIVAFAIDQDALVALGCPYGALPTGPYPRVCIPFRNPNLLANYLTISLALLAVGHGLVARRPWGPLLVTACVVAAVATFSTGIGGLALAAAMLLALRVRSLAVRRLAVAGGVIVAVVFALATVAYVRPPGEGHIALGERDIHLWRGPRVHAWLGAVETIREHPLLGAGYGQPVTRLPTDFVAWDPPDAVDPALPPTTEAHDVWLNVTAQAGFVGLAAFAFLLVQVARRLSFRTLPLEEPLASLPTALVAAVVGGFLYHGLFMGAEEARHLWALFGLVAATAALRTRPEAAAAEPPVPASRGMTPAS